MMNIGVKGDKNRLKREPIEDEDGFSSNTAIRGSTIKMEPSDINPDGDESASHSKAAVQRQPKQHFNNKKAKGLTYAAARRYLEENNLVVEVVENRHLTMGWHQLGSEERIARSVIQKSVGHFRSSIGAVPIAIGPVHFSEQMPILGASNCMHLEARVKMIAFRLPDEEELSFNQRILYPEARQVDDRQIQGVVFGNIEVICRPPVAQVKQGQQFQCLYTSYRFRKGNLHILARPLNVTRFEND